MLTALKCCLLLSINKVCHSIIPNLLCSSVLLCNILVMLLLDFCLSLYLIIAVEGILLIFEFGYWFPAICNILLWILIVWRFVLIIKGKRLTPGLHYVLNYKLLNYIVIHNCTVCPERKGTQRALTLELGCVPGERKTKTDSGAPVLVVARYGPKFSSHRLSVYKQTIGVWCQPAQVPTRSHSHDLGISLGLKFLKTGGNSNTNSWGLWGFIEVLHASANLNFQYVLTIMKYHYYIFKGQVFWNFSDGKHRIINSLYLFMLCQKIDLFSFTISFKMLSRLLCNHIMSDKIMPSVIGQVRRKVAWQT